MQFIVTCATGIYSYVSKSVQKYTFVILDTHHPDNLYLREYSVRIRGYFSKTRGFVRKKSLGNTDVDKYKNALFMYSVIFPSVKPGGT
jgi:galactokinase